MKNKMYRLFPKVWIAVVLSIFIVNKSWAKITLPSILNDNMVLQQQAEVALWGKAAPGATVKIVTSWDNKNYKTQSGSDGGWKIKVSTPSAGGPYNIVLNDGEKLTLKNILIGEVWICSGQSNMEMPMKGFQSQPVNNSNDFIAHSKNENLRLFTVKRHESAVPLHDCEGKWSASGPQTVLDFSATAYFFGNYLQDVLGVPVGLVCSCLGGTPAEAWTDEATLRDNFHEIDLSILNKTPGEKISPHAPTVLFNGMIHPLLNFTFKGAIWYQGEANRERPEQYAKLFPAMIQDWRDRFNRPDFPFYFVQIAPFDYFKIYGGSASAAYLREAQLKTMLNTPNTSMAVTMDIGEKDGIHPGEKEQVGKRLAYIALAKTYGFEGVSFSGPIYKEMKTDGNKAVLSFDYAEIGLSSCGKSLDGLFVVAGENRQFYSAQAKITGKNLTVWSDQVEHPVAVRYCWDNFAVGTLYNTAGLPASSFRTDDWAR